MTGITPIIDPRHASSAGEQGGVPERTGNRRSVLTDMTPVHRENACGKHLTSVMEDYLEAIFDLDREKKVVRVKDIARRMDVKMPTVSSMLRTLS